jgi:hypothetical protein
MIIKKTWALHNIAFSILIILAYLVVMPVLLHKEYTENSEFRDFVACEYVFNINECPLHAELEKLNQHSSFLVFIVIWFWAGVIFEQDIYPNREKILKKIKEIEDSMK